MMVKHKRKQPIKIGLNVSKMVKSLEDEEQSGRPSTSKNDEIVEKIQILVRSDYCLRVQNTSNAVELNKRFER